MKLHQRSAYLVLGLLAAVAMFLFGYATGTPGGRVRLPSIMRGGDATVNLLINDGEKVRRFAGEELPEPPTVLALLQQVTTVNRLALDVDKSSSLGAFVKRIAGSTNGDRNFYWQYYVDGTQPLVAADKYELTGGETVLWTFSQSDL